MDKEKTHFVLVAGFSADHLESEALGRSVEKRGFSTEVISFYGEGYIDDFSHLKISDCHQNISKVIDRAKEKYENVFGIGISLGGALLLEHAKYKNNLRGIASIGTPFKLINSRWIHFGENFLPVINLVWKRLQKIKRFRLSPIGATPMAMDYMEKDLLENLERIQSPVLLLHSKEDLVSDYRVLPKFLEMLGSEKKKITFFENGGHVIDDDPDLVIKYIFDFFAIN